MDILILSIIILLLVLILIRYKDNNNIDNNILVYASLTTIPDRAEETEKVIKGLMKQSYPIKQIFLNIPVGTFKRSGKEYYIPEWTKKPEYHNILTVTRTPEYGPATKLLGSLEYIPQDAYVYVVDDDIVHSKNHLKNLISHMKPELDGVSNSMCELDNKVCGITGFILKRSILNDIYDYYDNLPTECNSVDDVWMSMYLKSKKANIHRTNLWDNREYIIPYIRNFITPTDKTSLYNSVNSSNKNIMNRIRGNTKNSICKQKLLK